jgi:hypothetical protein
MLTAEATETAREHIRWCLDQGQSARQILAAIGRRPHAEIVDVKVLVNAYASAWLAMQHGMPMPEPIGCRKPKRREPQRDWTASQVREYA